MLPTELRRQLHPRRGGHPGPAIKIDKTAAASLREQREQKWPDPESLIARVAPGPEWVNAARRYLSCAADPAGAAVVALIPWKVERTVPGSGSPSDWDWRNGVWVRKHGVPDERQDGDDRDWVRSRYGGWSKGGIPDDLPELQSRLVDAWSVEHGLAFAACALVELSTAAATWIDGATIRFRAGKNLWLGQEAARRLRTLLAAAGDSDYREAVERLAEHRRTLQQKVVVSYLVPTRQDWLEECQDWLDDSSYGLEWLQLAIGTPERLAKGNLTWEGYPMGALVTLADTAGADALPLFVQGLDGRGTLDDDERRRLLKVIALMPFDEAFQVLVDRAGDRLVEPALTKAMTRFPARALRLLAAAGATELLAGHVRAHPELTATMLPDLPAGSRAAVEGVVATDVRLPEAEPDDLPGLLVDPPWTRERAVRKPVVIAGLEPPGEQKMTWAPGERETWSVFALHTSEFDPADTDWEAAAEQFRSGRLAWRKKVELLVLGPEEVARPLLADCDGDFWWEPRWMKRVAGRFGGDALGVVLKGAKEDPAECGETLLPYLNAEIAALMADWLARKKPARQAALTWFDRHGADAARMLFPAALGKAGRDRRQAERALRLLAGRTGANEIVAAARDLGDEAASAIEALVADPLEFLPDRMPAVGDWANPGALPQILLRGRERALPFAAADHVITMLAISKPGEIYAGVGVVRELCDSRSLAEFAWALFQRWEQHGAPAKEGWALDQLGRLGDDETVCKLAAAIVVWPGEAGHHKAVKGLDVLAAIGTDLALMHLHGISQRVKFKGLKAQAKDKIAEIAESRGLTTEQLADRTVPDFGLDDDGSMTLDYGPRRFTVGFDEALVPFVLDEDGRRRKTLPRPGASDDPDLAPAAYQRFSSMKKVARTASADQIRRLERAMVTQRRWTAAEFRDLFVVHPLVWHIARRLVWLAEEDGVTTAFRVAEDRTFADVHDAPFTLPGTAAVGIAHPLHLGDDLAAWREALEDYEILQPFPQIERGTYAFTEEERRSEHLARFERLTVRTVRVLALRHRGWERADYSGISRVLPAGRRVLVDLEPGLPFGGPDDEPEQRIETVQLTDGEARFGELDPVTASEIIADLTSLAGTV
ncbi:DUF4132 domain-containing protein [Actinomadura alba]|uniref:DUF4132 domain-containing protein n=1 Tax=Actinomadura alba TaxID=406431 RepID=A0ABR7LQ51_9ACTN|nr:DUF4132 domain-containing protein [Actinomadura alba]MBC6466709.1 DUF4132 domain-containing protein [Actinomadura alba]